MPPLADQIEETTKQIRELRDRVHNVVAEMPASASFDDNLEAPLLTLLSETKALINALKLGLRNSAD